MALQLENKRLSDGFEMQLGMMRSALNASRDGFAIWKVKCDEDGGITTFVLEFINNAGAAATAKKPQDLVGRDIEDVIGHGESRGLVKLFIKAIAEGKEQRDVDFVIDTTRTFDLTDDAGNVVPAAVLAKISAVNLDVEFARVPTTERLLAEIAAA